MEQLNNKRGSGQLVASKIQFGEDPLNAIINTHTYHHTSMQLVGPILEDMLNDEDRLIALQDSVQYPPEGRQTMLDYDMPPSNIEEEQPLDESETISPQIEEMNLHDSERVEPLIERVRKSMNSKNQKKKIFGLSDNEIECGEEQFMKLSKVKCDCNSALKIPSLDGDLIMTNYKIVFKHHPIFNTTPDGKQEQIRLPSFLDDYLKIPLSCINKIDKTTIDRKTNKINFLELYTKDFRYLKLSFESTEDCVNANLRIQFIAFPENEMHDIFAFSYFYPMQDLVQEQLGNDIYKVPELEFKRQGVDLSTSPVFRLFVNQDYVVCATYPRIHIIPTAIKDQVLMQCSKFRTKNRFPSLSYYEASTGCSIWRSSQTMTGFLTNRNQEDEQMLTEIARTNINNPNKLVIYDARSYLNAMANRMNKGGFENTKDYYTNCEIEFCDIDNIHSVRDAITKVYEMGLQPQVLQNTSKWLTLLDTTNWLQIISKILQAVNKLLDTVKVKKCNVLVHCTDGWDRTAQLCALAQIMLHPYYRTLKGFQVLIEKDWLSFGHMFQRRLGHYNKNYKDDQRCPIFIQFLDSVYQLLHQFPNQFEFNRNLLLFIASEIYTCKYGTFLCNSERERVKYNLREKTVSMWTYINHFSEQFQNPFYEPEKQEQLTQIYVTNYFELKVWKEMFFKYSEQGQYYKYPDINSPEDHKEYIMKEQRNVSKVMELLLQGSHNLLKKIEANGLGLIHGCKEVNNNSEFEFLSKSEYCNESKDPTKSSSISGSSSFVVQDLLKSSEEGQQKQNELEVKIESEYIE